MVSLIKVSDNNARYVNEYVADTIEDLQNVKDCAPGSTAIVLNDGNTEAYILNSNKEWKKL